MIYLDINRSFSMPFNSTVWHCTMHPYQYSTHHYPSVCSRREVLGDVDWKDFHPSRSGRLHCDASDSSSQTYWRRRLGPASLNVSIKRCEQQQWSRLVRDVHKLSCISQSLITPVFRKVCNYRIWNVYRNGGTWYHPYKIGLSRYSKPFH